VAACAVICQELLPAARVALRVVDDRAMQKLNRQYRGIDAPTDVLAFPNAAGDGQAGDIALNWQAARRQAAEHGHAPQAEAIALFAHAMLHLVGFNHDDEPARRRMDARTHELCKTAGFEVKSFGH